MELPASGPGWTIENTRPGWKRQIDCMAAIDVYRQAERLCDRHNRVIRKLHGERDALVERYYADRKATGDYGLDSTADPKFAAMCDEYERITKKLEAKAARGRRVVAIGQAARDEIRNFLCEIGFRELPEGEGDGC